MSDHNIILQGGNNFDVTFTSESFDVQLGGVDPTSYSGEYTVTPSAEVQTLPTANKTLSQNITVEPIPSYYGRITWNGSVLTVS